MKRLIFLILIPFLAFADSPMAVHALRLTPGQDVRKELEAYIQKNKIEAASVLSAVGSVTEASLRFANKNRPELLKGYFEVVSLSGTLGVDGSHLHMALSDGEGKTIGGHLTEGSKVYTTMEVVLGVYPKYFFKRTQDAASGYKELDIKSK